MAIRHSTEKRRMLRAERAQRAGGFPDSLNRFGGSRDGLVREHQHRLADLGSQDLPAGIGWARESSPQPGVAGLTSTVPHRSAGEWGLSNPLSATTRLEAILKPTALRKASSLVGNLHRPLLAHSDESSRLFCAVGQSRSPQLHLGASDI